MIAPIFVETRVFTESVKELLDDESYRKVQNELIRSPAKGVVIPGCGGLRKLRVSDPFRDEGKRGGLRAIYLNVPEADRIVLIALYGKDKKVDLTENEKKLLHALAMHLKQEALRSPYRRK